ncbi:alpha/beta hydrolase [Rhodococcus sp. 05-340-1]|uniref:alpha/beta fold hydrolase n=1 Tax=Nocardiaceae TaxID=85025 RepID=UPI0006919C75|nr:MULTISPECIES: alpha/beta hydrolase [Rhodococcus]OZC87691.1 alpha/beta hydrolase [Rhodococcus sp. 06-412-2C]OZC96342.1 alpha/beta hydrolase [Rhodococcus sp. 06-412-2B]OZD65325.1 alpha/beta hydrolase [Rhodococcus sp. 05-340-2]OZD74628.1 alpha/beta hydrolase [Rhodococcus sp. 05-340-1]OZD86598.1 alpha/beta hydrolase [Rhodococcus sp. 05-339-2]
MGMLDEWRDISWDDHYHYVEVDGNLIGYVDYGHVEHDSTILLLHGIAASWRWFVQIIPILAESHRVIGIDLPGFGGSDLPRERLGFSAMARSVESFSRTLGLGVVHLIGHSMGSIVATRIAADFPDRVGKLLVTGGPILGLADLPREPLTTLRQQPRSVFSLLFESAIIAVRVPRGVANIVANSAVLRRVTLGLFVHHPEDLAPEILLQVMAGLGARGSFPVLISVFRDDPNLRLDSIKSNTLVIRGDKDPLAPNSDLKRFLATVPDASAVTIDSAGHWPHLEHPDEFLLHALPFLAQ